MNASNCMVTQYRIRYRELGTSAWSSKTMADSGLMPIWLRILQLRYIVGFTVLQLLMSTI